MRYLLILPILAILLVAGCVSMPQGNPQANHSTTVPKTCHNDTSQEPYQDTQCNNIEVTKPVCGIRALPYDYHNLTRIDLCVDDSNCTGLPLGNCQICTRAMTRCGIIITNDDKKESGTWSVIANFTVIGGGFNVNPVSKELGPGESAEFDFQQMYSPGNPISSADCVVMIDGAPKVNDCMDVMHIEQECLNVTKYKTVITQVCD